MPQARDVASVRCENGAAIRTRRPTRQSANDRTPTMPYRHSRRSQAAVLDRAELTAVLDSRRRARNQSYARRLVGAPCIGRMTDQRLFIAKPTDQCGKLLQLDRAN